MGNFCEERIMYPDNSAPVCTIIDAQAGSPRCKCPYPDLAGNQCPVLRIADLIGGLAEKGILPDRIVPAVTRFTLNRLPQVVEINGKLVKPNV